MDWSVELTGPTDDLNLVAKGATRFNAEIKQDKGKFFLRSAQFGDLANDGEVRDAARELVRKVNRAFRQALRHQYSGIEAVGVIRHHERGSQHHQDVPVAVHRYVSLDAIVIRADGRREQVAADTPAPDVATILEIVDRNPDLKRALDYHQNDPSWRGYYMAFEAIIGANGGDTGIRRKGWASKPDITRFRLSARPGRHDRALPPQHPLSEQEGAEFIYELLKRWIDEEAKKP